MHVRDSIARVEAQRAAALEKERKADFARQNAEAQQAVTDAIFKQDSLPAAQYTLENDKIKLHINTQGGCIDYVDLKGYRTHDSLPLNFMERSQKLYRLELLRTKQAN